MLKIWRFCYFCTPKFQIIIDHRLSMLYILYLGIMHFLSRLILIICFHSGRFSIFLSLLLELSIEFSDNLSLHLGLPLKPVPCSMNLCLHSRPLVGSTRRNFNTRPGRCYLGDTSAWPPNSLIGSFWLSNSNLFVYIIFKL